MKFRSGDKTGIAHRPLREERGSAGDGGPIGARRTNESFAAHSPTTTTTNDPGTMRRRPLGAGWPGVAAGAGSAVAADK